MVVMATATPTEAMEAGGAVAVRLMLHLHRQEQRLNPVQDSHLAHSRREAICERQNAGLPRHDPCDFRHLFFKIYPEFMLGRREFI